MGLYNRYIPSEEYRPVEPPEPERSNRSPLGGLLERLLSSLGLGQSKGLSGLLGGLGLDKLDRGDILLVLILIYLFKESEDDEWLIILVLVLVMGL